MLQRIQMAHILETSWRASPRIGVAQRAPNHFLNEDFDLVDEAVEEFEMDAMELMDPCEALLLEGRRMSPSSAYMS